MAMSIPLLRSLLYSETFSLASAIDMSLHSPRVILSIAPLYVNL